MREPVEPANQQPDSGRNDTQSTTVAAHGLGGDVADVGADEHFQALVYTIPAVTFREDASNPGAVVFVSREIEAMLGYPLTKWRDEPRFWLEHVHPSDGADLEAELERTDATGDPFNMEYRMIAMDGRTVWSIARRC